MISESAQDPQTHKSRQPMEYSAVLMCSQLRVQIVETTRQGVGRGKRANKRSRLEERRK